MPPRASACCTERSVLNRESTLPFSSRAKALTETTALSAKSCCDHPSSALAALICRAVTISATIPARDPITTERVILHRIRGLDGDPNYCWASIGHLRHRCRRRALGGRRRLDCSDSPIHLRDLLLRLRLIVFRRRLRTRQACRHQASREGAAACLQVQTGSLTASRLYQCAAPSATFRTATY
jgi:hypothetical protein